MASAARSRPGSLEPPDEVANGDLPVEEREIDEHALEEDARIARQLEPGRERAQPLHDGHQIADFEAHGVHGFVLHPRVGLPRDTGWMSDRLLGFMRVAIEEAARRRMTVFLYDEGMYPSGSSSGQVVAENPLFRCRGLDHRVLEGDVAPALLPGENLVAVVSRRDGRRIAVFDRPVDAVIRGLHYAEDDPPRSPGPDDLSRPGSPRQDPPEETPPAADLLNPDAVCEPSGAAAKFASPPDLGVPALPPADVPPLPATAPPVLPVPPVLPLSYSSSERAEHAKPTSPMAKIGSRSVRGTRHCTVSNAPGCRRTAGPSTRVG